MSYQRKPWQHEQARISEAQFKLLIAIWGWEDDKFGADYGEDLFIRPFINGNPTGHNFYVQLKGTPDISQYLIKNGSVLYYNLDVELLRQWTNYSYPVILCVWDTEQDLGYWLHMQPFIEKKLKTDSHWLDSGHHERRVHIPTENILQKNRPETLSKTIKEVFDSLAIGKSLVNILFDKSLDSYSKKPKYLVQLALCDARIAENASNRSAWLTKAAIYYELQDMAQALQSINQLWKLDSKSLIVIWLRGCILAEYAISNGNRPKSMLHEAIELFESNRHKASQGVVDYNVGNSLSALELYEQAVAAYDRALLHRNLPSQLLAMIWKNRGTCFFHLNDHAEEFLSYQTALQIDPTCWQAYSSWAVTEFRRANFSEAICFYLKAFRVNPELERIDFSHVYYLAFAYWKTEQFELAYQYVNQSIFIDASSREAIELKADILSRLWRRDAAFTCEASSFFQTLLLDDTINYPVRIELYHIYRQQGDLKSARSILEVVVDQVDIPPQIIHCYALLLEEEGQIDVAIKYLQRTFQDSQEHAICHSLGRLKMQVHQYEEAVYYLRLASKDATNPSHILSSIADCCYMLGNLKASVIYLIRALIFEPNLTHLWENLILVLGAIGADEIASLARPFLALAALGMEPEERDWNRLAGHVIIALWWSYRDEILHWTD